MAGCETSASKQAKLSSSLQPFGDAAVKLALAMGARVIAMGRNASVIARLGEHERVETVQITGDMEADLHSLQSFGEADCYYDISPPQARGSTHVKSAMLALRHGGRVSLMGGLAGDSEIPHAAVMHRGLRIGEKFMHEREDVRGLVKMVEIGVLKLGKGCVRSSLGWRTGKGGLGLRWSMRGRSGVLLLFLKLGGRALGH